MSDQYKETLNFHDHFQQHHHHHHQQQQQQQHQQQNQQQQQSRATTTTIPPKPANEPMFMGTPMSNIFSENFTDGEFRSYSDLLMGPPATQPGGGLVLGNTTDAWESDTVAKGDAEKRSNDDNGSHGSNSTGFKKKRPDNLVLPAVQVSPNLLSLSPGFSPSIFLSSPTFLSSLPLSPLQFNMSPQQTLAQLTAQAQAALSQAQGIQTDNHHHHNHQYHHHPSSTTSQMPQPLNFQTSFFNTLPSRHQPLLDAPNVSQADRRPPSFPINVDKPADDGYNWRKYGQKQVKGSEYPRSYYRCTSPNCPVKKKVERSFEGHITEIIYKGQHNHDPPQRRRKDDSFTDNPSTDNQQGDHFSWSGGLGRGSNSTQPTTMMLNGPSDSDESGDNYHVDEDGQEVGDRHSNFKIAKMSDGPFTHRTMTEPKIVVQTRSEVDLLDDGYRWRKYGQKVVKGNPNPRSYYKCTTVGCKVRKHVERASTDVRAVVTTYEGKHNHDVPAARGSNSMNAAANIEAQQLKLHNSAAQMSFANKTHSPIALRLKEEQNGG